MNNHQKTLSNYFSLSIFVFQFFLSFFKCLCDMLQIKQPDASTRMDADTYNSLIANYQKWNTNLTTLTGLTATQLGWDRDPITTTTTTTTTTTAIVCYSTDPNSYFDSSTGICRCAKDDADASTITCPTPTTSAQCRLVRPWSYLGSGCECLRDADTFPACDTAPQTYECYNGYADSYFDPTASNPGMVSILTCLHRIFRRS